MKFAFLIRSPPAASNRYYLNSGSEPSRALAALKTWLADPDSEAAVLQNITGSTDVLTNQYLGLINNASQRQALSDQIASVRNASASLSQLLAGFGNGPVLGSRGGLFWQLALNQMQG